MATNAKIIKLGNGNFTYIPITSTQAIQHSYGSEKVVLESYLGGLQADIAKNATNITTLAGAALEAKANLKDLNDHVADYKASYVKAGEHTNQISYNLPNGTRGVITIDNVANAGTATNLKDAPALNKTATGDNVDSFTVTAGGKTSTAVSLSKASATAYGVAKVDSSVSSDSENPVQNKVIKKYADDTFVTKTAFDSFSTSGMHYKGDTDTVPSSPVSGDVYHVTIKITSGLGDGVTAEVGDFITYYKPEGGAGKWSVWDKNVDGAIYSGNNTLVSGQMLVVENSSGKVKSQAIPAVSVSGTGSGNIVKAISNNNHAITYTMGYAVDTLEKATGSANSGVLTNVTRTDNKLTVTYTDLASNDPASGTATSAVSVTYIASVSQASNGKITATKGTVNIKTMTGASEGAAGAAGLVPAPAKMTAGETVKVLGADGKWKTVAASVSGTNQTLTNNIKYAESNKTVEINEDLFGTFTSVGDIVTISTATPTVSVTVS